MTTAHLNAGARAVIEGKCPDRRRPDLSLEEENERLRVLLMAARQASQRRLDRAHRALAKVASSGAALARQGRYIESQRLAIEDAELALGLLDVDVEMARKVLADGVARAAAFRASMRGGAR